MTDSGSASRCVTSGHRALRRIASLALLATALAVTACGGSEDEEGGRTINWFVAIQPGGSIQEIAKTCSEQSGGRYNINLELLPTDADPQREQLVRRLGAEDSSVDLIGMDVVWTAEFANAGWLREWTGPLAKQVTEGIFPSVIESASFEGKLYGAPFNSNTQLLWYRKDQVPKPPATWEEMIAQAEELGGTIEVQANRYEGFTVWANALIEGAGGQILAGPEEVALQQQPTEDALRVIGGLANSSAAPPGLSTSDEDSARLAFEGGQTPFMINYTFAYGSASENAPDVAKNMGAARYPRTVASEPSKPPLGGFNTGVSAFSDSPEIAFEAAACINSDQSQLTAVELDGLPPTRSTLYEDPVVQEAFPGFAPLIRESIEDAGPRPLTPAYTDVSLAVQRTLHPPDKISADDVGSIYEELLQNVEDAVQRKGLL